MRDAGVLVLASDLEGEASPDGVERVRQGDRRDAGRRARHELVAVLH